MAYKFSAAERRLRAELLREQRQNRYAAYQQKKPLTTAPKKKNKSGLAVAGATAADIGGNVLIGLGKGIEGIYDFGAGLVGAVGGLFSDDFEDSVKQHVARDFTNELYGNALQEATEDSLLNDSKVGRIIEGVAQGVGQLLPTVAISAATAGLGTAAGLSAKAVTTARHAAAMASTMASAAGTSTEEAFNDGAEYGKGLAYGATMGAVEGVTEKLTGGIPVFGDGIIKGGKVVAKEGAEQVAKTGLKRIAKDMAGEGVEEMISELANPAAKTIYKGKDAISEYGEGDYWQGVAEAGAIGALTSVAYGGTVGRITKTSGVYADARSVMADVDTQVSEMATLEEKGKLTPEMEAAATKRIQRDYEVLSGVLQKASDKTRAELMKNPQVAAVFESDGTLKASVASNLDARIQYAGEGGGSQLMSRGVYGRESEIGEMLAKEGTEIYAGELTEAESENLSRLRKAHTALSRKGLVGTDFVISKESPKFNAYLDGNTVVIGKDTLTDGTYLKKLVHEVEHFAEGTKEWTDFASFVFGETNTDAAVAAVLQGDYGVTQADVDTLSENFKSGNLTKGQRTLIAEVVAHQSEVLFGDEQTILRLTRTNRTLAEKILDRIKAFLEVFKAKTPEEKTVVRRMQQAERLFEAALERAGTKYAVRELTRENPEETHVSGENSGENSGLVQNSAEQESTPTESGESAVQYSNKTIVHIESDSELADRLRSNPKSKHDILKAYLVENFYGQEFLLSDGVRATMDKRDAQKLAYEMSELRVAELSNLRDIIEKATLYSIAERVVHNKFKSFRYYEISVEFEGERHDILLNVGQAINDGKYHIYDITSKTDKKRRIAGRAPLGLSQVTKTGAIKNDSSTDSISQNSEMSTPDTQENFDKRQFSRKAGTFTHRDVDAMVSSIRSDVLTFTLEDGVEIKGKILSRDGVDLSKWLYDTLNTANLKDKRALARQIAMQIFDVVMAEDGRPLNDILDAAQADSVREDLALSAAALLGDKQAEVDNKRINQHLETMRKIVGEMQDAEKGRFYSATIYDGDTLRAIPGLLRTALKSSRVFTGSIRNTLAKVKEWYCAIDNAMLYKVTAETPIEKMADGQVVFDKDVAAMLEQLTAGTGNLTADELEIVVNIAKHFQKLSERYMRVFVDGKWLDAEKMAESMVDKAHRAKEDQNLIVHGITSGYMREFADPAALFRAMDGYDADGFFSTVHGWMREAAIGMQSDELHALSQYYEWHKEHKKWAKHLEKDIVTFRGHKMSLGQLLTLFCNLKTEKSKQGLADNGFKYTDKDGTVHRIKGLIYEQAPDSKSSIKHKRKAVREACKSAELDILKTLTAEQREYVKLLERVLNTTCRKWKIDTDVLLKGFSRVRESGYYFPSAHNGIAKTVDTTFYEGDRVTHLSLNHDVVEGARGELVIENIDDVVLRHVHNMALYKNYAVVAENRSMLQNIDVGRVDGAGKRIKNVHQAVTIRSAMEEYGERGTEMLKLLDKMSKDLQGGRRAGQDEQGFLRQLVESIRGNYARFQLGFNPKTMATQLSSVIASMHRLDIGCVIGGLKGMASKRTAELVDKYCPLAELRNFENSAALAAGVLETTGKIGDVLMKGIGWMDRRVVCALFEGCQRQVQKDNGLALGTEENLIAAGKLLTTIILETQQNSLVTERSDAMRGGFLGRSFSMFTADSMKNMGRVLDSFGEWATLKRRLKNAGTDAERVRLQKELKRVHRQAIRSTSVLVAQAVYAALIAYLFKLLYDRDEEDVEGNLKQAGADFFGAMLGGLPVFRDVYSYFAEGYELDNFFISTINDVLVSTKNAFDVASDAIAGKDVTKQEVYGAVRKVIYAGGQVFGIPTRNAYNFVVGVTRRFLPEVGYTVDSLFVAKSYSADLERAIEAGDEHMAETIAGLMIDEKIGIEDEKMREVLRKLAGEGYSVLPRSVGDSVTLDGEEHTLNGKQQKRFRTVYGVAEEAVADMVRLKRFAEADAAVQAKAIQFIYSVYWDLALEDVLGKDLAEKNVLFAEAIDIEKLAIIIAMARSLEADKDKDGNSIAGTKKRKVEQLVASLNLTAAQKYMVMGYLGYTNKNGKAQVEGYISRLKLTKDEKTALLKYSGYAA